MLKKNTFVKIINLISRQEERHKEVEKALDLITDGHSVFTGSELYYDALMLALKDAMNDSEDYISWWLYDLDNPTDRKVYFDGKCMVLDTAEKLYDFLAGNYEAAVEIIRDENGNEKAKMTDALVLVKEVCSRCVRVHNDEGMDALDAENLASALWHCDAIQLDADDFDDVSFEFVKESDNGHGYTWDDVHYNHLHDSEEVI